jgi:hypothetical protein
MYIEDYFLFLSFLHSWAADPLSKYQQRTTGDYLGLLQGQTLNADSQYVTLVRKDDIARKACF